MVACQFYEPTFIVTCRLSHSNTLNTLRYRLHLASETFKDTYIVLLLMFDGSFYDFYSQCYSFVLEFF